MRGGLWSSFSVPGRGYLDAAVDPYCEAGQRLAGRTDRRRRGGMDATANQSRLELLVWRQAGASTMVSVPLAVVAVASGARHRAGHQTAVIAPVEADPRTRLRRAGTADAWSG